MVVIRKRSTSGPPEPKRPLRAASLLLAALLLTGASQATATAQTLSRAVLKQAFPTAENFGAMEGEPPAISAYAGGNLVGYLFRTHAVVRSLGLSGKTLDILVGMDTTGTITGATILEHHEPIFAIGISSETLEAFVDNFTGRDVRKPATVRRRAGNAPDSIDAVSGATISSLLISDAIFQSARAVGESRGILQRESARIDLFSFRERDWPTLAGDGSVQNMRLSLAEVEAPFAEKGGYLYPPAARADPDSLFIDLWTGLATPAGIGRNLLGAVQYNRLSGQLESGDNLVFLAANGRYSFKGTSYRKTGKFDRIQITQGRNTFRFNVEDQIKVADVAAEAAPDFRESALFIIDAGSGFDPARSWRLDLIVEATGPSGDPLFSTFSISYAVPKIYLPASAVTPITPPSESLWQNVWLDRIVDVAFLLGMLGCLGAIFFLQDLVVQRRRFYRMLRYGFLAITLLWLGWYAIAQLSVLNVLTFAGALRSEFRWDFFLLEPLIFILWAFVAMSLLFGGRGAYCGWLCPFGALQELLHRSGRRFGIPEVRVPFALHERLWPIKYIVFLGLFALSLGAIDMAQKAAEVEPFKTAIVMHFLRAWPFVLYAIALLAAGLFIERFFCRYICPLGAALAVPARIRMFEWLKRHWQCGRQCQICASRCPVQAIHPNGAINPNECIYCLNCQALYYDDTTCPPMIERRKRREARAEARAAAGESNATG